jgi:ribose-phosphate pyrophosphokinase
MSGHPLKLFAGSSHPELAERVAYEMGTKLEPVELGKFSDGSNKVRLPETVRGSDAFVIQTCRPNKLNEDLMELFLMIHTLQRNSADKVHAIIPHLGYARDDSETQEEHRKSIAAQLMAILTEASGANSASIVNLHSRQETAFFRIPVDNLYATPLLVRDIREKELDKPIIAAPDTGSAKPARYYASQVPETEGRIVIINKHRPRPNVSEVTEVVGQVKGRTIIFIDDIIDTAGTACNGKKALESLGCNEDVYYYATHPVLSGDAIIKLREANFKEIVITDTIPLPAEKLLPNMRVLSVAPLLAENIRKIHKSPC